MRKSGLTRLLLVGLVVVTVLLFVRVFSGSSDGEAVVLLKGDFDVDHLKQVTFTVHDHPAKVEVVATGSLQSDTLLAAYAWILRDEDGEVVWMLDPAHAERGQGMTVTQKGVLTLEPGRYHGYFASYGDPFLPAAPPTSFFDKISAAIDSDFQRWRNEANKWQFSIRGLTAEDEALITTSHFEGDSDEKPGRIWTTGPLGSNTVSEYLFETTRPVDITVHCAGEIFRDHQDAGWIENIESGDHIWDMTSGSTRRAGGSIRNRSCRQNVQLPAGRFRAVFRTDETHAYDDWRGNPPFDPSFWGMEILAGDPDDAAAVLAFDPWESLPRVTSLTGIGDDQLVSYTFKLDEPMRVLVHALGEGYVNRDKMYDYAWIVGAGDKEIWKMKLDETKHAGGSSKNRRAETVLDLDAGVPYTVYYKTDGSHAYDDWNEDPPLHPDQWGVTIFALDPDFIPSIDAPVTSPVPSVSKPGYAASGEAPLASLQSIGNGMDVSQQFVLDKATSVHIYALGEMTRDGRYDWGWITNLQTGTVVWEMRRENSVSAGGTSKNRLVDTVIDLPQGRYEVHYVTDETHAFPDFRYGGAPDNPTAWGITIQLVEKGTGDP